MGIGEKKQRDDKYRISGTQLVGLTNLRAAVGEIILFSRVFASGKRSINGITCGKR